MAYGLVGDWNKVAIIDTEGSGNKYAGHKNLGPYQVFDLKTMNHKNQFSPQSFCKAIDICIESGIEVIVIDSASHEWQWCLDFQNELGGKYHHWHKVTPLHNKFVEKIIDCKAHVIVCTRRKTDYLIDRDSRDKMQVSKVGTKPEMREGFEYELDLAFSLENTHHATVEKDRTNLFVGKPPFVIDISTGEKIKKWAEGENVECQ